ncbi:uncharacterized protein EDB91DRAFT_1143591 [Suillus paluster]|uniref:uncharacterized protein n=1 Tax=Suillus paluster TaxID=48578 RepID=UPI001B86DE60|nr:uncharacterized protein EDB91DRAFT_1143591 [Suillus paluster]KAG1735931.1 hypothetical protein EDB91DRAFT_1143591 [Suillus paluster]
MFFNKEACFSKRVPKETIHTWLAHGGRIHSGETGAVASYFFAASREDEWTSILCRRSVVVIHMGWILHCVANSFRVPVAQYILDDGFDAGSPFSHMGFQDHKFTPVVSPRYLQRVPQPLVPRSQPPTPFCIPPNALQKRKRQRDSIAYPNGELGDSLPRRPRKRRMLSLKLPSPSAEILSGIAITEEHDSTVVKHNHNHRTPRVVTPDICFANTPSDSHTPSVPRYLTPSFKAMPKNESQVSSFHGSPQNDQGNKKPNCTHECTPAYTLTADGTRLITCLNDSPPVPAIDFTRLQFPPRNHCRFPLLRLGSVNATLKVGSREGSEGSAGPASSNCALIRMVSQGVHPATHTPGRSAVPETSSSGHHGGRGTRLHVTHRGSRVGCSSSPTHLGEVVDSRSEMVTYHIDQLIRTNKRATDRDDLQSATLWESNAIWKGMRFWHEDLKKTSGNGSSDQMM